MRRYTPPEIITLLLWVIVTIFFIFTISKCIPIQPVIQDPPNQGEKPLDPELPPPSGDGPIVITDHLRCVNIPLIVIKCEYVGELVECSLPCGKTVCKPGEWLLCPDTGLCYNADP